MCGASGSCEDAESAVTIASFTAAPAVVDFGADTTLTWTITGATAATISATNGFAYQIPDGAVDSGSIQVANLTSDTSFTISATAAGGEAVTETTSVTVTPEGGVAPSVTSFSASASSVPAGQTVSLSWVTSDATSGTVKGGGTDYTIPTADLASGSLDVSPDVETEYTIEVTNDEGSVSEALTVRIVEQAAAIVSAFSADRTTIAPGESVTLSWETSDADSVTIEDDAGATTFTTTTALDTGSTVASPTADTTYTLTASNGAGDVSSAPVTVTVLPLPVINTFTVSPSADVALNSDVTIEWDVTGAAGIVVRDSGGAEVVTSALAAGSDTVTITAGTSFTLEATNAAGATSSNPIAVTVQGFPVVTSFTASATTGIVSGTDVTFSWVVADATGVEIQDASGAAVATSTQPSGSADVTIDADETYTLVATNAAGMTSSAPISVTLLPAPTVTSFTVTPDTDVTPGASVTLTWDTTDAADITITTSGGATVTTSTAAAGTFMTAVTVNETYTLTASNPSGDATAMTSVTVAGPTAATIDDFETNRTATTSGELIQLDWLVSDAASAQITSDQGDLYDVPGGDVSLGSVTFRPQATTTYTLTATHSGGATVTATVTVTVGAAALVISEILYDLPGSDTSKEWVEVYNAGDTFVDLSHYSLGVGGAGWDSRTLQLTGTLAPGATHVVGGPTSEAGNGAPVYDQVGAISIQNGGSAADGVALFFLAAADITATSTPIDAVLYDGANIGQSDLVGEAGVPVPDAEVGPDSGEGNTLVRVGTSDVFVVSAPQPGLALAVSGIGPADRGPNESTGTLTLTGYGFDDALDVVMLGTTPLVCAATLTEMLCDLDLTTPSADTGLVDLTITRVNSYTPDAAGEPVVTALAPADQRTYTLADAFTFDGQVPDSGGDFYCSVLDPASPTAAAGSPIAFELLLYADGVTQGNPGSLPADYVAQLGFFDRADNPFEVFDATWVTTTSQVDDPVAPNNEKLGADLVSATARTAEVGGRVSRDGGLTWTYCDSQSLGGGSDDGWDNAGGVDVEWN